MESPMRNFFSPPYWPICFSLPSLFIVPFSFLSLFFFFSFLPTLLNSQPLPFGAFPSARTRHAPHQLIGDGPKLGLRLWRLRTTRNTLAVACVELATHGFYTNFPPIWPSNLHDSGPNRSLVSSAFTSKIDRWKSLKKFSFGVQSETLNLDLGRSLIIWEVMILYSNLRQKILSDDI